MDAPTQAMTNWLAPLADQLNLPVVVVILGFLLLVGLVGHFQHTLMFSTHLVSFSDYFIVR